MPNNPRARKNLRNFRRNNPATGEKDPRINRAGRARTRAEFKQVGLDFINEPTSKNRSRLHDLLVKLARSRAGIEYLFDQFFGRAPLPLTGGEGEPLHMTLDIETMLDKAYGKAGKHKKA